MSKECKHCEHLEYLLRNERQMHSEIIKKVKSEADKKYFISLGCLLISTWIMFFALAWANQ